MRKLEKERSPQDLQVGGGRGGGEMTEQGKSFDAGEAPQKTEGAPQKIGWLCMLGDMWKHETDLVH